MFPCGSTRTECAPHARTNVPVLSNSIIGCAPRCSTRIVPRGVTATDAAWMKFQTPGTPAALVGGVGHSTCVYDRVAGCASDEDELMVRNAHVKSTTTREHESAFIRRIADLWT